MKLIDSTIGKKNKLFDHKMLIFDKIKELKKELEKYRKEGKVIGFVPTMGALHKGHLSLIKKAKDENDLVVASIFVNPTQFNNPSDLKNYPRTPEMDNRLLNDSKVDIVFSPPVEEIYSSKDNQKNILLPRALADVMEGSFRPGHFKGVVQIVSKLFDIVKPQKAYFGEKDFQQLSIIRFMVHTLNLPVEIIACPTVREKSGLALSSRNLKLSVIGKVNAVEISKALIFAKDNWKKFTPPLLKEKVFKMIEADGKLKVEYIEIADEATLEVSKNWDQYKHVRCFAAVYCKEVRLIDNVRLF